MSTSKVAENVYGVRLAMIPQDGLVGITVLGDGNCFFHSVLRAFNRTYIEATSTLQRAALAQRIRVLLADSLSERDPVSGVMYYDTLAKDHTGKGTLRAFSKAWPAVSLERMQKELRSNRAVDNSYHELVSDKFNRDIYLISLERGDLYATMVPDDFYKQRDSIFIAVLPGHYDVLGIRDNQGLLHTTFTHDHPFVQKVRARLQSLTKKPADTICLVPPTEPTPTDATVNDNGVVMKGDESSTGANVTVCEGGSVSIKPMLPLPEEVEVNLQP